MIDHSGKIIKLGEDIFIRVHASGPRRWQLMVRLADWPHKRVIRLCSTKTEALLTYALLDGKTPEDKEAPLTKLRERLSKKGLGNGYAWQSVAQYWPWRSPPRCFNGTEAQWLDHMRAARGLRS